MKLEDFQTLVDQVIASLPPQFASRLSNVEIVVEDWPRPQDLSGIAGHPSTLFGLYRGVPHTRRSYYNAVLPDQIVIFAGPILQFFPDPDSAQKQIRSTVLHEIGHHFGLSEAQIRRAETVRQSHASSSSKP